MSRDLAPELAGDITAPVLKPFLAVHIGFPDPVYAWTGIGAISFAGHEWDGVVGVGADGQPITFASIDTIGESTDGSAVGVQCVLNMVPSEHAEYLADQAVRGVAYRLYIGTLDESWQLVRGYKLLWRGTLQSYRIDDGGEFLTVSAGGESRSRDQRRPAVKRFTDEYQQRKHAGDRFFEYVPRLVEVPILWAKSKQDAVV